MNEILTYFILLLDNRSAILGGIKLDGNSERYCKEYRDVISKIVLSCTI